MLTVDLEEHSIHKKTIEKKLSNAVDRMRETTRDQLQTKIETLCYHLGRMEKHLASNQDKNAMPTIKQALSVIPETISQKKS